MDDSHPPGKLPDYTLRISKRAKYLRIRVGLDGAVEVVAPHGADLSQVPAFVARERDWIVRAQARFRKQGLCPDPATRRPPRSLALRAIDEHVPVRYQVSTDGALRLRQDPDGLILSGGAAATRDVQAVRRALMRWLKRKAGQRLVPELEALAGRHDLAFNGAAIRAQKTLWGSCSPRKTISLNCKLLFLPAPLMRYVLLHELAHTRHMNHSREFWSLLTRLEPRARELDQALRKAGPYVPAWTEA